MANLVYIVFKPKLNSAVYTLLFTEFANYLEKEIKALPHLGSKETWYVENYSCLELRKVIHGPDGRYSYLHYVSMCELCE